MSYRKRSGYIKLIVVAAALVFASAFALGVGPSKYVTISRKGNIDISVIYLNPVSGVKDTLAFEVSLGTHC